MNLALVQVLIGGILALFPNIGTGVRNFVQSLTAQLPDLVTAGTDVVAFINDQLDRVRQMIAEDRDPTQDEWDQLNGIVASELEKLNAQAAVTFPPQAGPLPATLPPAAGDVEDPQPLSQPVTQVPPIVGPSGAPVANPDEEV